MQQITIGSNEAGQRLDKFLHKYLPNAGTSFLYKMLRKKNITLNGKKAEGKENLAEGDIVRCFFSDETFTKFSGKEIAFEDTSSYSEAYSCLSEVVVLYEDENILALNKPVGILTQKAKDTDLSLNEWLIGYLLHTGAITDSQLKTFKPSVCNRLDRNTSGLVLCGKSLKGSQYLSYIIKEHSLRKFYYTICEGALTEDFLLEGYLTKDSKTNTVRIATQKANADKDADYIKTAFSPLACGSCDEHHNQADLCATLLGVELFTGKTHQIRAHLSSIGHPILGDKKYGGSDHFHLKYQLLHAHHVIFPETTEFPELSGRRIVAPCPENFVKIATALNFEDAL